MAAPITNHRVGRLGAPAAGTVAPRTSAEIVATLLEAGPSRPVDVADRVGIARSTLGWHADRLTAAGLLEKRPDGNRLVIADHRRTTRLLETVDPTLTQRLVDRYSRLVDLLVEDAM